MNKNNAFADIAKKEMEKLNMRTELRKKTEALAAKEEDMVKARSEIAGMKNSQGKQMDLVSNLNILNDDAVKKLNEYKEEIEQKDTDLLGKNVRIKKLKVEIEEYKVIVQEYKGKIKQLEDYKKEEREDTKVPDKKRKIVNNRESSTDREQSTPRKDRSNSRDSKLSTTPTLFGPVTETGKEKDDKEKPKTHEKENTTPFGPITVTGKKPTLIGPVTVTGVEESDIEMSERDTTD